MDAQQYLDEKLKGTNHFNIGELFTIEQLMIGWAREVAKIAAVSDVQPEFSGSVPWVGKLHHARDLCDDWGCIRDDDGNRIMTISIQYYGEDILDKHRRDKTDPTQEIIDYVLSKLNEQND